MNVLLVYPKLPETYFSFAGLIKLMGKKNAYPPVGLLTVASLLPDEWNKKVVDINVAHLTEEDVKWADMVMISGMSVHVNSIDEITDICKKYGVKSVAGGPLFAHEHKRYPDINHFVLNEAELTLPPFLADLEKGTPDRYYTTTEFANVHESPAPAWELIDLKDYAYTEVQYSRGCPYMCEFCDVTNLFGRVPRTKTSAQIINELDILMKFEQKENLFFADDNFIGNRKHLKQDLLPALIEWRDRNKYAPSFATQLTINIADDEELMRLMLEAGFRQFFIGVETVDEEALKAMRKSQNSRRDIKADLRKIIQYGFFPFTGYISGLDTDTEKVFENQSKFIQESAVPLVLSNLLKAPPGTALFDRLEKEGRLTGDYIFDTNRSNVKPKMDEETLTMGYLGLLKSIYSGDAAYKRVEDFFNVKKHKIKVKNSIRRKFQFGQVITVLRVLYHLGIKSDLRMNFWKMFFKIARTQRNNLDVVVMFAGMMDHNYDTYRSYERHVLSGGKVIGETKKS